ncbi:MAG: RecX family transcriptional regulator [Clostridia bacterium]|nr:RecX family transcriptional regulator [Clostridia bacterium]MBQ6678116.1 RecX family transcriptional regulator [Clostridia bacterium]
MTSLKKVKRDGRRVTVTLAGEGPDETLRVGASLWDSLGIAEGDLLSDENEEKLRRASALSETVTDAMRIAADSPHSVSALVMKLTRRGHGKEDAARAVRAMISGGLLDEAENARHTARSIFNRTKRGPERIRADLLAKGYPAAAAKEAADGITDEEYEEALRYHAARRDFASDPKTVAALCRLGFSIPKIKEILK